MPGNDEIPGEPVPDEPTIVEATVRFTSPSLDPDVVTDIVQDRGDFAYRQGQTYWRSKRHKPAIGQTGLWLAETGGRIDSADPNDHLRYVLELTAAHSVELLEAFPDLEIDFSLFWRHAENVSPESRIDPDILDRLQALGEVEFDVSDEDDPYTPRKTGGPPPPGSGMGDD